MAGEAAQQRVFGDEAEIAAGEGGLVWVGGVRAPTHTTPLGPPHRPPGTQRQESGTEGSGTEEGWKRCESHRLKV